jgi:hypothetical protein
MFRNFTISRTIGRRAKVIFFTNELLNRVVMAFYSVVVSAVNNSNSKQESNRLGANALVQFQIYMTSRKKGQ